MTQQSLNAVINVFFDLIPEGKQFLSVVHPMLEHSRSFQYFEEKLRSIEILNEDRQVEKVYFREPLVCKFLTGGDMEKFRYNLKLETQTGGQADMKHFVNESHNMYYHLLNKVYLSEMHLFGMDLGIMTSSFSEHVRRFQVRCIYLVSLMVVLSVRSKGDWTCCQLFNSESPWAVDGNWDPAQIDRFSLETFYDKHPWCYNNRTATHNTSNITNLTPIVYDYDPVYDALTCTSSDDGKEMLRSYDYARPWHKVFIIVLLVFIFFCNFFGAVIHLFTKFPVHKDAAKRDEVS